MSIPTMMELWLDTLLRSSGVAVVVCMLGVWVVPLLREENRGPRTRTMLWGLLLLPLLTPVVLTAYGYRNVALLLVPYSGANEALYFTVMCVRLLPLAVLILYFAPPPGLSPAGRYLGRLASLRHGPCYWLQSPWRSRVVVWLVVFLLSFQDFELATLFEIPSWTRRLFDARAIRVSVDALAMQALWPFATEAILLILLVGLLIYSRYHNASQPDAAPPVGVLRRIGVWLYLTVAGLFMTAIPMGYVCITSTTYLRENVLAGKRSIFHQQSFYEGLGYGVVFAMSAAIVTAITTRLLLRKRWIPLGLIISFPGLTGALLVALSLMMLFQLPQLNAWYDTPVPMTLALFLLLMPVGILLMLLMRETQFSRAAHIGGMLRASNDISQRRGARCFYWRFHVRPMCWVLILLFLIAFFEVTATAILHPSRMIPATVAAYNNMHYGQNTVLSARVFMNFITTGVVVLLLIGLGRIRTFLRLGKYKADVKER